MASKGAIFDWNDGEAASYGINVNNPKIFWQMWTHALDVKGHTYGIRFASKYYPPDAGWLIVYNKELTNSAGYDNIPELIKTGKWDWDTYLEIAKDCVKDIDGDGQYDKWGIGTGYAAYGEEVLTGGGRIISMNEDGTFSCTIDSADAIAGLDFIKKIGESGAIMPSVGADGANGIGYSEGHAEFVKGNIAFLSTELRILASRAYSDEFGMRRADIQWGLAPLPKRPGDAYEYHDIIGNHDYDFMLQSNKDREFSIKVYAAFARRQNDEDWTVSLADSYLQDPSNTTDLEILSEYVIPNIIYNAQWLTPYTWQKYREVVVFPLFDSGTTAAQAAEAVKGELNSLIADIQFK